MSLATTLGIWFVVILVLAVLLVALSRRYALRKGMLDVPGRRRSHTAPTPRGGGIGLLMAALPGLGWAWLTFGGGRLAGVALLAAMAGLAVTGWLDDHRSLPSLPRLVLHLAAGVVLALVVLAGMPQWPLAWRVLAGIGLALAATWSINLHNFMDGIDALLGMQMLFCLATLAGFAFALGVPLVGACCLMLSAATLGFLCFNRPPARIFMGDAGSTTLGWLLACLAALLWREAPVGLWLALILMSGFIVDATTTLLRRMWRGRRWYTAHREHAYQWLVRSGWSHGQVVALYLAWNLLVCLPAALLAAWRPSWAPGLLLLVAGLGVSMHVVIRRACRKARDRRRQGVA